MKNLKTNLIAASLALLAGTTGAMAQPTGDFNNDGFADFIVAAPQEDAGSNVDAGAVWVFYGGSAGIQMSRTTLFDIGTLDGQAIGGEKFGTAVCVGDYNGDGYADAAISAPHLLFVSGDFHEAGVVVMFGGPSGLTASNKVWKLMDEDESIDFGAALAAGDFNGDGREDLAVGAPLAPVYERVFDSASMRFVWKEHPGAGRVYTYTSNVTKTLSTLSSIDYLTLGMTFAQAEGAKLGTSLAAGDFNADGKFDVAAGAPGDGGSTIGAVHVFYGGTSGIATAGRQYLRRSVELSSLAQAGQVLAAGKFNGDGSWDLAMGCPSSTIRGGSVSILYGRPAKFKTDRSEQIFSQQTAGMQNDSGISDCFGDDFGKSLAVGRLNGDGFDDLAIGIPSQDFLSTFNGGAVQVLLAKADGTGLSVTGNQFLHQADSLGIGGARETNDFFGLTVAATRKPIDRSSTIGNLIVGVPFEDVNIADDGMIQVLRGGTSGVVATGQATIHQDSTSVPNSGESGDRFGGSLGSR